MIKEWFFFASVIGICLSASIPNIQPESESSIPESAVEEVADNQDLETAEGRYGFGPRVVVINKGYGGYRGGGYRGCGCGRGYSHYHSHRYFGKKK